MSHPVSRATAPARTTIALPSVPADGTRPLRLTRAMLEQARQDGRLDVHLPGGERFSVTLEADRLAPGDQWTVVGRVQTRLGPQAMVLTSGPDAIFGVLPLPDGSMMQVTTTRGRTEIAPAGDMLPPGNKDARVAGPDYLVPPAAPDDRLAAKAASRGAPSAQPPKSSSPVDIDVLGLYTGDLVELRGSVSAAETEVTSLFAIASQAHLDSGTRVRLQVASLLRVDIDPEWSNHEALDAITANTVPSVDLYRLRDEMAADLVALVRPHRETHGTCGVAWLVGGGRIPLYHHSHYAVSVSNVAPCGPFVLVHELGHNMGSTHDRETESINGYLAFGAYQYSFGYRQDGPPAFATVMAYSSGQPEIGYFSNPGSTRCGAACGVDGRADNVRSLNATAPQVAAFRGPPGTLSITDVAMYEPEPGRMRTMSFPITLSGPAPAGGVHFDVFLAGGTADPDDDYVMHVHSRRWIPEGERSTSHTYEIIGDARVEPDETILVRLANVTGAVVHKGEATGTILNDDPRPTLSGHLRFVGAPAPDSAFPLVVRDTGDNGYYTEVEVSPPDYAYSVPIIKGASIEVEVHAPPPFAILPFIIDELEAPMVRNITVRKGLHVTGRATWPAGDPAPTAPIQLDVLASIDTHYQALQPPLLQPPDFRYSYWIVPGAWLYMAATPAAPYESVFVTHSYVDSDLVQDIPLSRLPGLVLWGGGRIRVSPHTVGTMSLVVQLSTPAPKGGVRMRYRTVDGTARAGTHYTAIQGEIEIPEGDIVGHTDTFELFGAAAVTGDRYFDVVLSDIVGANPVVSRARVLLAEQDREMSDPLPPRRKK